MSGPGQRRRRILFRLTAVLFSLLATLLVLEFFAWLFFHKQWPRKPPLPTYEWIMLTGHGKRLRPNLDFTQWFQVSNQVVHFQTNSLGIRGREISLQKPAGVTRVLVLGDSITLSAFLPEERIFTVLVEKILSAHGKIEVINAGIGDTGMKEQILVLKDPGLKLKPDIVLVGFYLNDSRPPWGFENEYYRLSPSLIEFSKTLEQYSYLYKWVWKRFLVRRFMGRNLAGRWDFSKPYEQGNWRTDPAAYRKLIENARLDFGAAWREDSWKTIYQGMDEMKSLAEKNHFRLAVVIFPVAIQVSSDAADDFPQQKMMSYCASRNIPCLDLLPVLRPHKNEDLYFDHCHLTALGHQLISQPISDLLASVMRQP